MFTICRFKGNQMNAVNGRNLNFTGFSNLADHFDACIQGSKHHSYWVRGELDPIHRKDDNLKQSNIFIIDGDASLSDPHSAPDPYELHQLLIRLGWNHFIYTTHSHNPPEKNKFRCILECAAPYTKQDIKTLSKYVVGTLNSEGYPLQLVKEMNTWSQPWFYPTRDDPADGHFHFFKYVDGHAIKMPGFLPVEEVAKRIEAHDEDQQSLESLIEDIRTGRTFHAPLLTLSYQYVKDGMPRKLAILTLQILMDSCITKDARWQERYDSIPGLVDGAISRLGEQEVEDEVEVFDAKEDDALPAVVTELGIIEYPPGLLGELVQSAYKQQFLHSNIFAFVSAMGLVAGITGRTFNVLGTGLNIEMLVIARTGRGKDAIRKFISQTLINLNEHGESSSFLAPSRFTGPVAMYNALKDSRSCVSVQTECGLIRSSETGDQSGIVRYQLGLYSASGKNEMMGSEGYSSKEGSIQSLRAAAMTFIMESTAESFSSIFNNEKAFLTGELPRVGIYRESDFIPETDFSPKPSIPDHVLIKLKYLTQLCSRQQAKPTPDVIDLQFETPSKLNDINDRWRNVLNSQDEDARVLMATRNTLRTVKYAAIAAAFNNEPGDHVIHDRELDWANCAIEAEFNSIEYFFRNVAVQGDIHDVAKRAKRNIVKALNGSETGSRAVHDSLRIKSMMTLGTFKAICLNIKAVRDLNDRRGGTKDGAQKLLDYFVANSYCTKPKTVLVQETGRQLKCIQFTREFNLL